MRDQVNSNNSVTPILFPLEPEKFWKAIRLIIREELEQAKKESSSAYEHKIDYTTYKPLYKIAEVCTLFQVTKPTIYDWIRKGTLKPLKIRSRVYFLWQDVQQLLQSHLKG